MKAKGGQVALYLVMVLLAVTFLMLMNVGAFLAVRARNKTMNAGDAAALAVASYQGQLLNKIGELNLEHLRQALEGGEAARKRCVEIIDEQARICFMGPLGGISRGNAMARDNDIEMSDEMQVVLRTHVADIRSIYIQNPDAYPPPWEGAWEEYACAIEQEIASGLWAGPDNIDFVDYVGGHMLTNEQFYNAIAGRNWCWFHFNAAGLLNGYTNFRDWGPIPVADPETRCERCMNSEIYSLGLARRVGSALELFGKPLIAKLLEKDEKDIPDDGLLADRSQVWFCYGWMWRKWWEIDPDGEWQFPVVGKVKPEYDVRGCAAICRVTRDIPNLTDGGAERVSVWSAAAKPFGIVENLEGKGDVVTAYNNLVTPAFSDTRLVPLDTVGGRDLSTADPLWMLHLRVHLPKYLKDGPTSVSSSCYYCRQLQLWEQQAFREQGRLWLKFNSSSCVRPTCGGSSHGGSAHGH